MNFVLQDFFFSKDNDEKVSVMKKSLFLQRTGRKSRSCLGFGTHGRWEGLRKRYKRVNTMEEQKTRAINKRDSNREGKSQTIPICR
jgi:hypothetical protein